jgi:hypothetical protein
MKILVACEFTATVRTELENRGHDVTSCDLLATEKPGKHYQGDVRDILYAGWDALIAHPVCTRLTNAGVRWLKVPPPGKTLEQMWKELEEGAAFYKLLRDAPIELKAIENPIMHYHAKAIINPGYRQHVQPWWFGDPFFKSTGFELIGFPPLVATNKLIPPKSGTDEHKKWSAVHRASPGPNREKSVADSFLAWQKQWLSNGLKESA